LAWSDFQPSTVPSLLKLDRDSVRAWSQLSLAHKVTSLSVGSGGSGFDGFFEPIILAAATLQSLKVLAPLHFSFALNTALSRCEWLENLDLILVEEFADFLESENGSYVPEQQVLAYVTGETMLFSEIQTASRITCLPVGLISLTLRTGAEFDFAILRPLVALRSLSISISFYYKSNCFPLTLEELTVFCKKVMRAGICCLDFARDMQRLPSLRTLVIHDVNCPLGSVFPLVCLPQLRILKLIGSQLPRTEWSNLPQLEQLSNQ
jgi:hypothetical protein